MRKICKLLMVMVLSFLWSGMVVHAKGNDVQGSNSVVSLTHNGVVTYYDKIDVALTEASSGDTITLLYSTQNKNFYTGAPDELVLDKDLTINLASQSLTGIRLHVTNGANIKIGGEKNGDSWNGTIGGAKKGSSSLVIDEGTVTLENVFFTHKYNTDDAYPGIIVGKNEKNANLIINDGFFDIDTVGIMTRGSNNTVTINNIELLQANNYGILLHGTSNKLIINNAKEIRGLSGAGVSFSSSSKDCEFILNDGVVHSVYVYGENPNFTMNGGKVDGPSGYGILVEGKNANINIKDGSISGAFGGIYGYASSENANITIDNVNMYTDTKPNVNYGISGKAPIMNLYKVGKLTINGGTFKGDMGIILLQGEIVINGGNFESVGEGSSTAFWGAGTYNLGIPVIVDNTIGTYPANAKVTIKGGTFTASADEVLLSVADNSEDFVVSGGTYNRDFNPDFVVSGEVELKINDEDIWYVGNDARNKVESIKDDNSNTIEVLQGNLTINNASKGLKVTNSGNGKVYINEEEVKEGETVIAKEAPKTEVSNPNTNDNILTYVIMLVLSFSILVIGLRKKAINNI